MPPFLKDFPSETDVVSSQRIHKELRTAGDLPGELHAMVLKAIALDNSLIEKTSFSSSLCKGCLRTPCCSQNKMSNNF